jgi:3'-phosphoadenosine 5'-phosphosulfate sulfotransferase (PAPS reductase)/FAD synthetase
MWVMTDKNIEITKIQREIEKYIGLGPNSLIYDFGEKDNMVTLHLVTVNPRHNQSFLFHTDSGYDKVDVLKRMLTYVKSYKNKESSYTIQWRRQGEDVLQTSYFSAKNVQSALDKLFYDRDPNSITIFSVIMNPMT